MTVAGAERLKAELQRLKTVDRPAVIQAIAEARSHGDLSENADYDAAKDRQGFIEGRITEIETSSRMRRSSIPRDRCRRPHHVRRDRGPRGPCERRPPAYQIVGDDEADIKAARSRSTRRSRAH